MEATSVPQKSRTGEKQSRPNKLVAAEVLLHHRRQSGRTTFLVLQLVNLAMCWLVADGTSALWLLCSGSINSLLYLMLIISEVRNSRVQIEPLVVYLAAGLLRTGIGTIWLAATVASGFGESLRFGPQYIVDYLTQGQLIMSAGDWAVVLGWTTFFNIFPIKSQRYRHTLPEKSLIRFAIALLIFGWFLKLLLIAGVPLLSLGSIVGLFTGSCSPAAIYLLYLAIRSSPEVEAQALMPLFMVVLCTEVALGLMSYMKSAVIIFCISLGLCATYEAISRASSGTRIVTKKSFLGASALLIFILFILFPFSQIRRGSATHDLESTHFRIDVASALKQTLEAAIPGSKEFREMHTFPFSGAWAFLRRNSDAAACAWVAKHVDTQGNTSGMFVMDSIKNLVPRVVWPSKPPYHPGAKVTVMAGGARSASSATSSTAVGGLGACAVLNFGYYALPFTCTLFGVVFAAFSSLIQPHIHYNPLATILYFSLVKHSAMHFENVFDCGIQRAVMWLVVYGFLLYISRNLLPTRVAGKIARNRRKYHRST